MAQPDCLKNALVSGISTAVRTQYLFPSSFLAPNLVASVFNNQLFVDSNAPSLNVYKNNVAIYHQFGGSIQGPSKFRLPITKDDAQKRIHWQVDLLDFDGLVGGSFFFATDCEFTAVDNMISSTVDTTDITSENQVIHLSGISTVVGMGLLYEPTGSSIDEPLTFAEGIDPDNITRPGYQTGSTLDVTTGYTSADNGVKNITLRITDDCGNQSSISFTLNVNIP